MGQVLLPVKDNSGLYSLKINKALCVFFDSIHKGLFFFDVSQCYYFSESKDEKKVIIWEKKVAKWKIYYLYFLRLKAARIVRPEPSSQSAPGTGTLVV